MKNPKLLFAINILIIIYLGLITFFMFNDFLMYEEHHHAVQPVKEVVDGKNQTTTKPSMFVESAKY